MKHILSLVSVIWLFFDVGLVAASVLVGVILFIPYESRVLTEGVVVGDQPVGGLRLRPYSWRALDVRLKEGPNVKVLHVNAPYWIKGRRVLVREEVHPVLKFHRFVFVRYLDEPAR